MTGWRPAGPLTPAAELQQRLWDSDPDGWALFAEPHTQPLFEALLEATSAGARPTAAPYIGTYFH